MQDKQPIKVGDTVYLMKRGWSGVPMEVLELNGDLALCKGTLMSVDGLISYRYGARVVSYNINRLTHEPDSMIRR